MKVLKSVGAQVVEQLQHGLVDQLRIGPLEAGMTGGADPVRRDLLELVAGHPRVGDHQELHQTLHPGLPQGLHVPLDSGLEGLLVLPFRVLAGQCLDPLQDEGELGVHRLFHPQGAVVVEDGDALSGRDKGWSTRVGHVRDEGGNGLLGRPVVPGRQGIRVGRGQAGDEQEGEDRAHGKPQLSDRECMLAKRTGRRSIRQDQKCQVPASMGPLKLMLSSDSPEPNSQAA